MDLDDAHLRERDDRRDRLGDEILTDLRLLSNPHASQRRRAPCLGMA